MEAEETDKLNYEDFFKTAIITLRDTAKSRGIHCVYSGFNQAFRKHFGDDPVRVAQMLAAEGKIEVRPVRGGVMIYLPGEGPAPRSDLGEKALSKILGRLTGPCPTLIEQAIASVVPEGVKRFPQDFIDSDVGDEGFVTIEIADTSLQLAAGSNTLLVSPKKSFRYEAKNPSEAKYVLYAHSIGETQMRVPSSNQLVFKAVVGYEKYCQSIAEKSFEYFIKNTNDEEVAEDLTKETIRRLGLISLGR